MALCSFTRVFIEERTIPLTLLSLVASEGEIATKFMAAAARFILAASWPRPCACKRAPAREVHSQLVHDGLATN